MYLARILVQYIGTETFDTGGMAGDDNAHMVLGDNLYRIMVREYGDVGMVVYRFYQARLYLGSRIVGMVQDTKLGVSSFFMQIEFSAFFLIEINSPSDKRLDLGRGLAHDFLHGCPVTDPVAGDHRVFYVLLEIIYFQVGYGSDTSLREICVGFFLSGFTDKCYALALIGYFQSETHTGDS